MRKRWAMILGGLLTLTGLCGGCIWSQIERPRFSQTFEVGGGRTLTVWSIRRDTHLLSGNFLEINPLTVYYRVDAGARELVPTTFLDHDDGGEYQFRVALADGGRLACVYEVTRAGGIHFGEGNHYFLLMYDADSGESWPRLRDDETNQMSSVIVKWRERLRRLRIEHPDLPAPGPLRE